MQSLDSPKQVQKASGEPYVWFTGMGLTIGLFMVIALIGLIVVNGLLAFWPRRVAQVVLKDDRPVNLKGSKVVGGEIIKTRPKTLHASSEGQDGGAPGAKPAEWQ
jgi:ABC-type phosphate transport system auxiliary subunit